MRQVTIEAAKVDLSELIEAALTGEEIIIAKGGNPAVQLVPVARRKLRIGLLENEFGAGPDFLEPMGEAELSLWEGGLCLEAPAVPEN